MTLPTLLPLSGLLVVCALTSCDSAADVPADYREPADVLDVDLRADGQTLGVNVGLCGIPFDVEVEEGAEEVRIGAFRLEPPGDGTDSCVETEVVRLAEPLGEREVIDAATTEPVLVEQRSE